MAQKLTRLTGDPPKGIVSAVTIAGLPALTPSTPRREAVRAAAAALAAGLGGALWKLADAADPNPAGPLAAFTAPQPAVAPSAWGLDHFRWHGLAGWPAHLAAADLQTPLRAVAMLLVAAAALAILHPGAFQRPAPYYLAPFRRAVAYVSAALIAIAVPAALGHLGTALAPDLVERAHLDAGVALRLGIAMALFCAFAWTMAGPGILNVRAALRFSHGALAGISVWAALTLAVLLAQPLADLAELAAVGNAMVAVDAGHGAPGATYAWILCCQMLTVGLGLGLAAAVATSSAPQSMGAGPRAGAAGVAAALAGLLLLASWRTSAGVRTRVAEAAPDVVALAGLARTAPPRPLVLLMGDAWGRRRVPPRQALVPVGLAPDCVPATAWGDRTLPPASDANLAALVRTRLRLGGQVSGLAARLLGCEIAMRARLLEPQRALDLVFADTAGARTGFFAFYTALRGLAEHPAAGRDSVWLRALLDTSRYTTTADGRQRLERLAQRPVGVAGEVTGRLDVAAPAAWRVALEAAVDPASGVSPWLYAARTDAQALQYAAVATMPDPSGRFTFAGVAPGWYQIALLAPEGTSPDSLATLSIRGDPAQFIVRAASRRDLGTIRIRP